MKLTVNLGKDSYPIYIENNILSQAVDYILKIYHGKLIMIISDDNVFPLYELKNGLMIQSDHDCPVTKRNNTTSLFLQFRGQETIKCYIFC